MSPSSQPRVFISYARKDGASLAQRLQSDLAKQGFDARLDTQRIAGGATWTTKLPLNPVSQLHPNEAVNYHGKFFHLNAAEADAQPNTPTGKDKQEPEV